MVEKMKNNLNITTSIIAIIVVVAGWISNYTVMKERINYIELDKNELKHEIFSIKEQIKDYNVLIYKVDKIDSKLDQLMIKFDAPHRIIKNEN